MWSAGNVNICRNDESLWTCDQPSTYKETFAALFHLDSQLQSYQSVISYMNGFVMSLLMMNVLIAIVTNYFMIALEKGDQSFWRNRMQFVVECQSLFGTVSFMGLCHSDLVSELDSHNDNDDGNDGVLDKDDDEERHPMVNVDDTNDSCYEEL